ncbi:MAG: DNA ligase D [Opitutaceae bacterium]|nr:DNA ligase D [Cytophagales bacterium]
MKSKQVVSSNTATESMPSDIKPMLATLVNSPLDEPGWIYEVKWDGFRALAYVNGKSFELRSRNNKSFNKKFYPVYNALRSFTDDVILDGEIIVVNKNGHPDFAALQSWRSEADGQLVYYVFDVLWYKGQDLMGIALKDRREVLNKIIPGTGLIRQSENFKVKGSEFFAMAEKMGLEGIIAKKEDSLYKPDLRSKEWVKIKTVKQQEAIIAGYTRNESSSRKISALLLGVYQGTQLQFIGPVGSGFTNSMQEEIIEKLKPFITSVCPFKEVPEYNKPSRFRPNPPKAEVVWFEPKIVAEINYKTVASDGTFRHPTFKGLREDKSAKEVQFEVPISKEIIREEKSILSDHKSFAKPGVLERNSLLNPTNDSQVRNINGHDLKFANLSKIYWPDDNVSKRDMLNYYYQVAPFILPYVQNRPQTLYRFPNGIKGMSFYQKDVTGKIPEWIETYAYFSEADDKEKHFLVINDEASLLYVASLGCIEINPWSSQTNNPDHPDWCILDLDPDKNTFDQVIEVAREIKSLLDQINVPSYCKTSGSTGLHIYIPLEGKYTYEDSKEFGRALVKIIHKKLPNFTSIERIVANRSGKMYLDFLQNRPQATVAAAYSLRPKPGATVSMPLNWEEVKKGLKMTDFNIKNAVKRINSMGDIFRPVIGTGVDIIAAKAKLDDWKL